MTISTRKNRSPKNKSSRRRNTKGSPKKKSRNMKKSRRMLRKKYDGMFSEDKPPEIVLNFDSLVYSTFLYYDNAFLRTLDFFKNDKDSSINKLIASLFNYTDIVQLIPKKVTIFGYFIISNNINEFYTILNDNIDEIEPIIINDLVTSGNSTCSDVNLQRNISKYVKIFFKCLIDNIKKVKEESISNLHNICEHNKSKFKELFYLIDTNAKYRSILYKVIDFIYKKSEEFIPSIFTDYFSRDKLIIETQDDLLFNIIIQLTNFIYACSCVDKNIVSHILDYYLLCIYKSDLAYKYNIVLKKENRRYRKYETDLFNKITLNESIYKDIDYLTGFQSKYGKFSTCGETTILNVLNYYLIDKEGKFNLDKIPRASDNLLKFYVKYPSMSLQIKDTSATMTDWLDVVSNLPNKRIYNKVGDIHNNVKNIEYVFKTILNSEESNIESILNNIDENITIEITRETSTELEFNLNNQFKVFFVPGHGQLFNLKKIKFEGSSFSNKLNIKEKLDYIDFGDYISSKDLFLNDFKIIYNFYNLIDYEVDFEQQYELLAKKILINIIYENKDILYKILRLLYESITKIDITIAIKQSDFLDKFLSYFRQLTNLKIKSHLAKKYIIPTLRDSLVHLNDLEDLEVKNYNFPLYESLDNLHNLTRLSLSKYDYKLNYDEVKNLKKLRILVIESYNKILTNALDSLESLVTLTLDEYNEPLEYTVSGNTVSSLKNLKNLKNIYLHTYNLPLGNSLNGLTLLNSINLPSYTYELGNILYDFPDLEQLDLDSYEYKLDNSLKKSTKLNVLFLGSYNHELYDSLSSLKKLVSLNLQSYNKPLTDYLNELPTLEVLDLNSYIEPLRNSLDKLTNLTELRLNKYELPLGNSLDKLVNLEELYIDSYNNEITIEYIEKFSNLKVLSIESYEYNTWMLENRFPDLEIIKN